MAKPKKPRTPVSDPPTAARLPWQPPAPPLSTALLISLAALLVRALVSVGPYSGQGAAPKFGDYEAQRHWMELTLHLPSSDWYRNTSDNDLAYWGLDYPPLSAYQSRLHALLLNASLPDAVALRSSRGFESPESKLLMRWTVLSSDLLVFFPAALGFVWAYMKGGAGGIGEERREVWMWLLAMVLINPCLVLIDHGHFQYNCISLGLTLGAIAGVLSRNELVACALFTLAINHKQMSLYFAPAFFSHLLGKCLKRNYPIFEVMKLGFVVLGTFALVWWPYLHSYEAAIQVISRLAPFERGIYEDYVANFWCSTSVLIKWKRLFAIKPMKLISLSATILAFLPSFVQQVKSPSNLGFLYALLNSSFSFYIFSYQVHEKSILLPLLPASLLALQEPQLYSWFTYYALFSMYPLVCRDQLLLQYIAVLGLFFLVYYSPGGSYGKGVNIPSGIKAVLSLPLFCSLLLHIVYLQWRSQGNSKARASHAQAQRSLSGSPLPPAVARAAADCSRPRPPPLVLAACAWGRERERERDLTDALTERDPCSRRPPLVARAAAGRRRRRSCLPAAACAWEFRSWGMRQETQLGLRNQQAKHEHEREASCYFLLLRASFAG